MTAQGVVASIGGLVCLLLLIAFARSLWRKPPTHAGSNDPLGGMPPGSIGNNDIGPGHHGT